MSAHGTHEALALAALWLHAAYDRPPQTPECRQMLAVVDAALLAGSDAIPAPAAEPYGWVYERADGFRVLHKAGDCQETKLAADRDAAARYPEGHRLTTVYAAPQAHLTGDFRLGAKAMFDYLLDRAANSWHANPKINAECERDATVVTDWAADALANVTPEDHVAWKAIGDAYREGLERGRKEIGPATPGTAAPRLLNQLVEALETCVEFIGAAHILEAQWDWRPVQTAQAAIDAARAEIPPSEQT